jgi:hypothetical protein
LDLRIGEYNCIPGALWRRSAIGRFDTTADSEILRLSGGHLEAPELGRPQRNGGEARIEFDAGVRRYLGHVEPGSRIAYRLSRNCAQMLVGRNKEDNWYTHKSLH